MEAYTYRMGAHTTTDDPTRYRLSSDVELWRLKDPIQRVRVHLTRSGLADQEHELRVTLADEGQLTIGGFIVSREPPLQWPVAVLTFAALGLLLIGLRDIVYVVARSSGWLQPRQGVELRPPLPRLPDWQPARRT